MSIEGLHGLCDDLIHVGDGGDDLKGVVIVVDDTCTLPSQISKEVQQRFPLCEKDFLQHRYSACSACFGLSIRQLKQKICGGCVLVCVSL